MILLVLLAALLQPQPANAQDAHKAYEPVSPEQVLVWQLEGLTQQEVRQEVTNHGLTDYPETPFLSALSAAGADAETIRIVRHAKGPRRLWKWDFGLPKPTDYLYEVAGALLWGDLESALETMQRESARQPRNADVHMIYAHFLRVHRDWVEAYAEATQAVRLAPQWPYAHALRSSICYHSQLASCASREAALFVEMCPDDAAAYIVMGHAQELRGDHEDSLRSYAHAEKLDPQYSATYAGMGRVYFREDQFEQAARFYERAIKIDRNIPEYYCELARVYLTEGDTRLAIEQLRRAKEIAPNSIEVSLALANAYLVGEDYSAAVNEYRDLLD